ncbi:ultraviolet-B receptor UVR8 [Tanacetum coccineum]
MQVEIEGKIDVLAVNVYGGDALTTRLIPCSGQHGSNFPEPVQIACGAAHTVVLVADNGYKLWSWGKGRSGVLGNGQKSDKVNGEKSAVDIIELEKKLIIMERYASILHGLIFGMPFEVEKDIPDGLEKAGSFDVGKEWEHMLEYCDYDKLVSLNEDVDNLKKLIDETTFYDKQWQATWQDEKKEVEKVVVGKMRESGEGGGWENEVGGVMVVEEIEWKMKKI